MTNQSNDLGGRIRFARILKGLSQQELGELVSTSRQFIFQIESGTKSPSQELLGAICDTLEVTKIFMDASYECDIQPDQFHFRKRRSTPNSLASRVAAFGTLLEQVLIYLDMYVDLPPPFEFEIKREECNQDGEYTRQQIENISNRFRETYSLGQDTPIDNVTTLLENLGVVVTSFNGVSDKVDALSFTKTRHYILRNSEKASVCRQRFDLAHELGHLILHQGVETGDPRTEAEADHFASAFLFPNKAFVREFHQCLTIGGSFRWEQLFQLKRRWKVSARAIIYRAHSLGLVDSRQYRSANIYLSKIGRTEPLDEILEMEPPILLNDTFDLLLKGMGISFAEISNGLGFNPKYLSEMMELDREDLIQESNISALKPMRLM